MNYKEISNEELRQLLREKFPGAGFKEVADYNRQTVIAILGIHPDETRRMENVPPEDK
jgi:hypothetical protein